MADVKATPEASTEPAPATTTSSSSSAAPPNISTTTKIRNPQLDLRSHRPSPSPGPSKLSRRRSSVFSYSSIEDATLSFTDDVLNAQHRASNDDEHEQELTHWHSSPLAFAILPAIGGLLFKNGSAFITDVLLLGLAAIFMNWSIRLPWDWYYTAQARQRDSALVSDAAVDTDAVDDNALDNTSSTGDSPRSSFRSGRGGIQSTEERDRQEQGHRDDATLKLRHQEMLALVFTFVFPVCAAYLLHIIRAQLSGPSTTLVSDYNLSIFLLAAEIQPCRQLARLIARRTLYLQRVATDQDDPLKASENNSRSLATLEDKIADLELRLKETLAQRDTPTLNKSDVSDLATELKKRFEPRLEGLERAVRRYEKRSTTLAIMMDQRLQSLELRTQEALSLAAITAQHSQERRGSEMIFLSLIRSTFLWPLHLIWRIFAWPINVLEELYTRIKINVLGPARSRTSSKRGPSRLVVAGRDEKPREKTLHQRG